MSERQDLQKTKALSDTVEPVASVVIPVYNAEKFLAKAVESISRQDCKQAEFIFVNDGSTDASLNILEEFAKKDKRIRIIDQKNAGQGAARNRGVREARGKYILFADADDEVEPDMISALLKLADRDNLDIVLCNQIRIDEKGRYLEDIFESGLTENRVYNPKNNPEILLINPCPYCKLMKKELVERYPFTDRAWFEDMSTLPKILAAAKRIGFTKKPLYRYRYNNDSIMLSKNAEKQLDIIPAIQDLQRTLEKDYKKEIEFLALSHAYIYGINRAVRGHNHKETVRKLRTFVENEFPDSFHSPYLKRLNKKEKLFYRLIRLHLEELIPILNKVQKLSRQQVT